LDVILEPSPFPTGLNLPRQRNYIRASSRQRHRQFGRAVARRPPSRSPQDGRRRYADVDDSIFVPLHIVMISTLIDGAQVRGAQLEINLRRRQRPASAAPSPTGRPPQRLGSDASRAIQSRFSADLTSARGPGRPGRRSGRNKTGRREWISSRRRHPLPAPVAVFLDQHVRGGRRDIGRIYYFVARRRRGANPHM